MEKEKDKKDHLLSGFFDKCREMYSDGSQGVQGLHFDENTDETTAKIKLARIKRILEE